VATELIKTLQQITSSLVVQQEGRSITPADMDGASSKDPNNVAAAPVRAPFPAPAPAPAAASGGDSAAPAAAKAPPAPAPKAEMATAASIIEGFGRPQSHEAALNAARVRLQAGGEAFWGELFAELQNVMFMPEPERRPASSEPYIEAMLALPEPYVELLRKRLTPVLLKKLTTKRAPTVPRDEVQVRVHAQSSVSSGMRIHLIQHSASGVQSFAELFAVLVKHRVVAMHGALTTMQMLLKKPDNRMAAVLMASHVVRVCDAELYGKEQASMEALRGDLMQIMQEPAFKQDISEILRKARQVENVQGLGFRSKLET
jgi:hypothetical protein